MSRYLNIITYINDMELIFNINYLINYFNINIYINYYNYYSILNISTWLFSEIYKLIKIVFISLFLSTDN